MTKKNDKGKWHKGKMTKENDIKKMTKKNDKGKWHKGKMT